jgi:hypothetical protein
MNNEKKVHPNCIKAIARILSLCQKEGYEAEFVGEVDGTYIVEVRIPLNSCSSS